MKGLNIKQEKREEPSKFSNEVFDELVNYVNNFTCENWGITADLGSSFECIPDEYSIWFSIATDQNQLTEFYTNFNDNYYNLVENGITDFTASLLHEIGHCENPIEETNFDKDTRDYCSELMEENQVDEANKIYYTIPSEDAATQWAADFLSTNEGLEKVLGFQAGWQKLFVNWLDKIGYEE